jgi:cytochrome P450
MAEPETNPVQVETVGATEADELRNRMLGVGFVSDPYPLYARLRDAAPVHPGAISTLFPVPPAADSFVLADRPRFSVYSYGACEAVLRDADTFSSTWYEELLTPFAGRTIIGMDEPDHRRMRMLIQPAFSRAEMGWWTPEIIRPIVHEYLDRVAPLGTCDLYRELGATVPIHTVSAALGLPVADRNQFFEWAVRMSSIAETAETRVAASRALADYIAPLVAERRSRPHRDLITVLAQARVPDAEVEAGVDARPLSDEEIASFVRFLVIAGAGTTYRAYGSLMYQLLTHPDQLAEVTADRSLVPAAIEESLRLEQPTAHFGRVTRAGTELGGVAIPANCPVTLNISAANHDPAQFADPDRFDVHRERADRHLSFGFGIHRCVGIHLARAELHVLLDGTLDRLANLRLDPGNDDVHMTGLGFRMPTRLPVLYDPAS